MKILNRLFVGFSLVLIAALFVGIIGIRSIEHLADLTDRTFRHPFTVTNTILEVKAELLLNQRLMSQLVHNGKPEDVAQFEQEVAERVARINRKMALVRERFLGRPGDVDDIEENLAKWRAARSETLNLMRGGRVAEAIALNDGRDARLGETVFREVEDVTSFAFNKAASFKALAEEESRGAVRLIVVALVLILTGGIGLTLVITRSVEKSLQRAAAEVQRVIDGSIDKLRVAEAISAGDLGQEVLPSTPREIDLRNLPDDELGALLRAAVRLGETQGNLDGAFRQMILSLRRGRDTEQALDWLKSGLNDLHARLGGDMGLAELADAALSYLVEYMGGSGGALYLCSEETGELRLAASHALPRDRRLKERISLGEGLLGEAARQRKSLYLTEVPADYFPIGSSLGETAPKIVAALPLVQGDQLVGALEIAALGEFGDVQREFLELARAAIAIKLRVNLSRQRMAELLEETQQQAEELRVQQEELQQSNEELEERAQLLEQQQESIRAKNLEIEAASQRLRQKARELARVSTYKSEFLANMSHELRTPLNSLMILSSLLAQNKEGNLRDKQVEYARTIHSAGTDLLLLINDILDLAKVEAGQMQIDCADIPLAGLCDSLASLFAPLAEKKGLAFGIETGAGVPPLFLGDEQRLRQILRNLIANALKFTEKGRVTLGIAVAGSRDNPLPVPALAFAVSDTGIGISPAHQKIVFEAFQQADGSISRKFGGTGLGLSISLQLARRMQGEIRLESREGEGSVFTLYLPILAVDGQGAPVPAAAGAPPALPEGRARPAAGVKRILIVEDDANEAASLLALLAEEGVAASIAATGREARERLAAGAFDGVILDLGLADMSGFELLDHIRQLDPAGQLPVVIHSGRELSQADERRLRRYAESIVIKGAKSPERLLNEVSLCLQPAERRLPPRPQPGIRTAAAPDAALEGRKVLLVDDDMRNIFSLSGILEEKNMTVIEAANGREALARLAEHPDIAIVLMDIMMPEMDGYGAMERIRQDGRFARLPVIAMTAKALKGDYEKCMAAGASDYITKPIDVQKLLSLIRVWLYQAA